MLPKRRENSKKFQYRFAQRTKNLVQETVEVRVPVAYAADGEEFRGAGKERWFVLRVDSRILRGRNAEDFSTGWRHSRRSGRGDA